ncbi:MAG: helix-turn-helix domain-containing protein [Alphaproteobacteria bacterium]|jgi:CRP-like cAMP-binding protein|nr:helix-turn-helix domain-containing protein [Alphaproteobacteria bacterium]
MRNTLGVWRGGNGGAGACNAVARPTVGAGGEPAGGNGGTHAGALPARCAVLLERGWLAGQPASFQREVLERSRIRRYGRGETVIRRGEPAGGIYGVIGGNVEYRLAGHDDEEHPALFGLPGAWFGGTSVLSGTPQEMTVALGAPAVVAQFPASAFELVVGRDPAAWRRFATLAARECELLVRLHADLKPAGGQTRIASRLLGLLDNDPCGFARPGQELALTQWALAEMSAVSRHTVNRFLVKLRGEGVLSVGYGRIVVHDLDRLRALAGRTAPATGDVAEPVAARRRSSAAARRR